MTEQPRIAKAGSAGRRRYQLGRRQAAIDATRARILDAASDLLRDVGTAATTASAVARRAGVTRATLYRHFATQPELLAATMAARTRHHSYPKVAAWAAIGDPAARLRAGLGELYAWYRATEPMNGRFLRDASAAPPRAADLPDPADQARKALLPGWPPAAASPMLGAALGHATAFETWRSLKSESLADDEIVELMVRLVRLAAGPGGASERAGKPRAKADPAAKGKADRKHKSGRKPDRKRKEDRKGRRTAGGAA